MIEEQIIKKIAELEYNLFVVNMYAAGIQQNDGRYITKYFPMSPFVIEQMIKSKGSMGCYQQNYKGNKIRWICFDFDCKDKVNPDVEELYKIIIKPFVNELDKLGIRYLLEFSGRRGIHVWILFNCVITKELGYKIVCTLENKYLLLHDFNNNDKYGLDKFPTTFFSNNNVVGKQVKFPLSCHKSGVRSYLFINDFSYIDDTKSKEFLNEQLEILEDYKSNDVKDVLTALDIDINKNDENKLIYKKYKLIDNIDVELNQVINILSKTIVFKNIFERMKKGLGTPYDWTVLLGTLYSCDFNGQLVKALFKLFPKYDEQKTNSNIDKLGDKYYPATFSYLYHIYNLEMENWLDKDETGFHFLLREIGLDDKIIKKYENINEKVNVVDLSLTVNKEKNYLKDNDEVPDVMIWNDLRNLNSYDLINYEKIINGVLNGNELNYSPNGYKVYKRIESLNKTRTLVSLSAQDRVITTNLALRLCKSSNIKWNSYSYHVSYTSTDKIFYYWYSSWKMFLNTIKTYIELPFMRDYEVFYIDLKGFYDHVDFLSIYKTFENIFDNEEKNIFSFLTKYNDSLMKIINNGRRIGVPQGPAYARIVAEIFIDLVLKNVCKNFNNTDFHMYRYVDDIVFFCEPGFDSKKMYDILIYKLQDFGLKINDDKTIYFGKISSMSEQDKNNLMRKDSFNYELKENEFTGFLVENEKRKKLKDYIMNNQFDLGSLGYIFGTNTFTEAQDWCLTKYRVDILKSNDGRGGNFKRFYNYLFKDEFYMNLILDNSELNLIPKQSLNFSNFVQNLYYAVQDGNISCLLFERIKNEYLTDINVDELNKDDKVIVEALKKLSVGE